MREKLQKLMSSEQLTASRFAELLGIQPSGVTHLLGGRNKPSFDLVQKILRRFPRINPDWLLLDSDQMYRPDVEVQQAFQNLTNDESSDKPANSEIFSSTQNMATSESSSVATQNVNAEINNVAGLAISQKRVKRVIVLFDDHTFESFEMSK